MRDIETSVKTSDAQEKSNSKTKAFFFLRHNNDIDHITPVIHKWLLNENVQTDIIIPTSRELLNDYRINFLRQQHKNANIYYISDLFKKISFEYLFNLIYFKYDTQLDAVFKKNPSLRKIADKIVKKIAKQIFKGTENGFIVFDWTGTYFTQKIVENAKEKNFTTISLPHGDRVYFSLMEQIDEINYDHMVRKEHMEIYDYIVVPNKLCAERYDKFVDGKRLKILGSSRYSDEWRNIISKLIPQYKIEGDENKLKIVMFLRNIGFPIYWEEVARTIKLITQFPEVYLIVKNHPRSSNSKHLEKQLLELYPDIKNNLNKNLKFLYAGVNSFSLLNWADVTIDIGTSIAWEAIKQGKPVLSPEYLNANYTYIAGFFKESEIKYRDQLYETIKSFIKNKNRKFYNEEDRQRFIKEIIDFPDKYSLDRYHKFLKMCLNESIEKNRNKK